MDSHLIVRVLFFLYHFLKGVIKMYDLEDYAPQEWED